MTPTLRGDAKIKQVAEHLGLHPETIRIMARSGAFPNAYKTGPKFNHPIRIPWSDVEDYRKKMPRVNQ
jgi:predicted DNA-binding transcriptional regulator AlpA